MPKKKEIKQIFEDLDPEATDVHARPVDPAQQDASQESPAQDANAEQAGDEAANLRAEMMAEEQSGEKAAGEIQPAVEEESPVSEIQPVKQAEPVSQGSDEENLDEILGDVRKSLLEESEGQEGQAKWWRRIGRSSQKKKGEEGALDAPEEINLPPSNAIPAAGLAASAATEPEPDEYEDQIDELIDMLEQEEEPLEKGNVPIAADPVPASEQEKPVDIEELKKQAFQARPDEAREENQTDVRSIALEGEEEVFVEVEATKPDQLEERISAVENALKPYQRYINFTLAFLGLVMAVIAGFLIYNAYQRSVVQEAATQEVSNLPFPSSVALPGGWSFPLGKGSLTADGNWNPAGAEWLQGTEVCRWVALPYSRQLEAVIRTLNPDDPIELGMSNNDQLVYNVYSINQMSPAEMRALDTNKPCLLIVLAEPGAEKRWVLTALP